MLEIQNIIGSIKNDFPEQAIDLSECFDLVLDTLDNTVERIQNKITQALDSRNFEQAKRYMNLAEEINKFESEILSIKQSLELEDVSDFPESRIEEAKNLPNYEDYYVDTNIPHTLYENLAHKRPFAFELNAKRVEVKTWVEVLLGTCEILINYDFNIFSRFESDSKMNGKKSKYFSANPNMLRKPVKLEKADLFIETNMSANSIRNLIIKMLQKYGVKSSEFIIFLRADYTELHKD